MLFIFPSLANIVFESRCVCTCACVCVHALEIIIQFLPHALSEEKNLNSQITKLPSSFNHPIYVAVLSQTSFLFMKVNILLKPIDCRKAVT